MIFRLYHETAGGHVHCHLFAGSHDGALGKCGDFCMRVTEFAEFQKECPTIEYREYRHVRAWRPSTEDYRPLPRGIACRCIYSRPGMCADCGPRAAA